MEERSKIYKCFVDLPSCLYMGAAEMSLLMEDVMRKGDFFFPFSKQTKQTKESLDGLPWFEIQHLPEGSSFQFIYAIRVIVWETQ